MNPRPTISTFKGLSKPPQSIESTIALDRNSIQSEDSDSEANDTEALPNLYDSATFWQRTCFSYVRDLLVIGSTRPLSVDDLPDLSKHDDPRLYSEKMKVAWEAEKKSHTFSHPSLWRAIYQANKTETLYSFIWLIGEHAMMIAQPLLLRALLSWLSEHSSSSLSSTSSSVALPAGLSTDLSTSAIVSGLVITSLLFIASFLQAVFHHQLYYATMRAGWNLRISFTILVHDKLLTLDSAAASMYGGKAMNLMSTDVFRFDQFIVAVFHYFSGPVDFAIILALLTRELTITPALTGCVIICIDVLLKLYLGKKIGEIRSTTAALTDNRVFSTKEVLTGTETIKSYHYEDVFLSSLSYLRSLEHASIFRSQVIKGINFAMLFATPSLAFLGMFGMYFVVVDEQLTLEQIFTSIALINVLRTSIGKEFSRATENGPECNVAVKRFENFLLLPETGNLTINILTRMMSRRRSLGLEKIESVSDDEDSGEEEKRTVVVDFKGASFSWPVVPDFNFNKKGMSRSVMMATSVSEIDLMDGTLSPPASPSSSSSSSKLNCLSNLNLTVSKGELLVVLGVVGAGKSALINAILGELNHTQGSRTVAAKAIGFASQTPFITAGSVKSNVTFASKPVEPLYSNVLKGCALAPDIKMLPHGDDTVLGERGVNLSGGQRARLGLARAIYSQSDLLLLDDPLAAVDPEVRLTLFKTIRGRLCNRSAVVLVTHHSSFATFADKVLVLGSGGEVVAYGTPLECEAHFEFVSGTLNSESRLRKAASFTYRPEATSIRSSFMERGSIMERASITERSRMTMSGSMAIASAVFAKGNPSLNRPASDRNHRTRSRNPSHDSTTANAYSNAVANATVTDNDFDFDASDTDTDTSSDLITKESSAVGKVSYQTYAKYFRAGGRCAAESVFVLMVVAQTTIIASDYWLVVWATADINGGEDGELDDGEGGSGSGGGSEGGGEDGLWYFYVYVILIALSVFFAFLRAYIFFSASLLASSTLHLSMLSRVLHAPMSWTYSNPLGRILNRFSADQGQVDEQLATTLFDTLQMFFCVVATFVVICYTIPWVILIVPPTLIYLTRMRTFITASTRELKRFENLSRSPVYEVATSSMNGLSTIRAFKMQSLQSDYLVELVDVNAKSWYWWTLGNRYFGFRLDMISVFMVGFSSLLAVTLTILKLPINQGLVGLAITYVISLSGMLQYVVRQTSLVETLMTSVERVLEYGSDSVPCEAEVAVKVKNADTRNAYEENEYATRSEIELSSSSSLSPNATNTTTAATTYNPNKPWPTTGSLSINCAIMKYRPSTPYVLKGVTFSASSGSNVGICGRTGAGKSSLVNCIFRLNELEEGSICIDGVDISTVPLSVLRNAVTLIPQSPMLFDGTVRFNLDPRGDYSDEEIKQALEDVQLSQLDLDTEVGSNGDVLSVGEKQLASLARACLRKTKIVVCDEPSANVDLKTDETIRAMLSGGLSFKDATVVVIAHRISTIAESDVVVVLEGGKVKESGGGKELLEDKRSVFRAMLDSQTQVPR